MRPAPIPGTTSLSVSPIWVAKEWSGGYRTEAKGVGAQIGGILGPDPHLNGQTLTRAAFPMLMIVHAAW